MVLTSIIDDQIDVAGGGQLFLDVGHIRNVAQDRHDLVAGFRLAQFTGTLSSCACLADRNTDTSTPFHPRRRALSLHSLLLTFSLSRSAADRVTAITSAPCAASATDTSYPIPAVTQTSQRSPID